MSHNITEMTDQLEPPALKTTTDQTPQESPSGQVSNSTLTETQDNQQRVSEMVPRDRLNEVINERNQTRTERDQLREQIARYEQQLNQARQSPAIPQMQYAANQPQLAGQQGLGGQVAPALTEQQQVAQAQRFLDQLGDKKFASEWQGRIAEEGVSVLAEFVTKVIDEYGGQRVQEILSPIMNDVQQIRQNLVNQYISQYSAQHMSNPEFQVVEHQFRQLAQQYASDPRFAHHATNPEFYDRIRIAAENDYRRLYGTPPQNFQGQQGAPGQPPAFSERPGNAYMANSQQQVPPSPQADFGANFFRQAGIPTDVYNKYRKEMMGNG